MWQFEYSLALSFFGIGIKTPNGQIVLQALQDVYINLGILGNNMGSSAGKHGVYISGQALATNVPAENQTGFYARFA